MACTITEIKAQRILSPSQINLGEYVINLYRGCNAGCLYCYTQKNKGAKKRKEAWGSYVDVKINAPNLLIKEIEEKKPAHVLIGSTTESYQPVEEKYALMREILQALNAADIGYTILTKSDLILRDIDLFMQNKNAEVYVTYSPFSEDVRSQLEPRAISNEARCDAIRKLLDHNIRVRIYVNPLIPYAFDIDSLWNQLSLLTGHIDFENLNIAMTNWEKIYRVFKRNHKNIADDAYTIIYNNCTWDDYWGSIKDTLFKKAHEHGCDIRTFFHGCEEYFSNVRY